jgi:antitoxin (DNA-binding transcriptional repressor) of toxin-antitoxin stability system
MTLRRQTPTRTRDPRRDIAFATLPAATILTGRSAWSLGRLVDEVAAGAEIIIAKAGKPMARLAPLSAPARKKNLGLLKGKIKVPDDFNAPLDDETLASFEGR